MDKNNMDIPTFRRFPSGARGQRYRTYAALAAAALPGFLAAQEETGGLAEAPWAIHDPARYDALWKYAELYANDENPYVQSVRFTGRFQYDYAVLDTRDYDALNLRRLRAGLKAKLFENFTIHSEVSLDPDEDPVYQGLTDVYLAWSRNEKLELTLGKHSAPFTMDGQTSSKELLTIDRSNLSNNMWFTQEYIPGFSAAGVCGPWRYMAGVYSSGSASREFGNFDGKYFVLGSIGYDFSERLGVEEAVLMGNYVYNEPDADNSFTRSLRQVASVNFSYDTGKWGFRTDLTGADGYLGQSDLWGFMAMPFYDITDHLQAVARYTYVNSEDVNGVRLARYESEAVAGRGDEYNEFYAGLNYYLYGHKLKIQTGVQYADMQDRAGDGGAHDGWGWTTGLRISW